MRLGRRIGASQTAALAAGLLFAVLPIHTEVVNDVVGRSDLLAALGVVAALLAHRRAMRHRGGRGVAYSFVATVAVFCAMAGKESGVAVVPLLIIFDWYWHPDGEVRDGRRSGNRARWWTRTTAIRLAHFAMPTVCYLLLRYVALDGRLYQEPVVSKTLNVLVDAPMWQHALGVIQLWGMYWHKTLVPVTLCVDYSVNTVRLATGMFHTHVLSGIGVSLVMVISAVRAWRGGKRLVTLCTAGVLLSFAPTSNAVVLIQVFFAERIWYLPSVFVCLLLGAWAAPLLRRRMMPTMFAVGLVAMGVRCWVRNVDWKDTPTLAAAAYRDHPRSILTLEIYGKWLALHGDYVEGIRVLRRAITMDPGFITAHRSLGEVFQAAGDDRAALRHWRFANRLQPNHPRTRAAIAVISARLARAAQSELASLERAAHARPEDPRAELAYVDRLLSLGRLEDALDRFAAMEARHGASPDWQQRYAFALADSGRTDEAVDRYRQCTRNTSGRADLYVELIALLMDRQREGDLAEAEQLVRRAREMDSGNLGLQVLKAELLVIGGDPSAAVAVYRDLLANLPMDHPQQAPWRMRMELLSGQ